jgi:hypothetical protein
VTNEHTKTKADAKLYAAWVPFAGARYANWIVKEHRARTRASVFGLLVMVLAMFGFVFLGYATGRILVTMVGLPFVITLYAGGIALYGFRGGSAADLIYDDFWSRGIAVVGRPALGQPKYYSYWRKGNRLADDDLDASKQPTSPTPKGSRLKGPALVKVGAVLQFVGCHCLLFALLALALSNTSESDQPLSLPPWQMVAVEIASILAATIVLFQVGLGFGIWRGSARSRITVSVEFLVLSAAALIGLSPQPLLAGVGIALIASSVVIVWLPLATKYFAASESEKRERQHLANLRVQAQTVQL